MKKLATLLTLVTLTSPALAKDSAQEETFDNQISVSGTLSTFGVNNYEGSTIKGQLRLTTLPSFWGNEKTLDVYVGGQFNQMKNIDNSQHSRQQSELYAGFRYSVSANTYYFLEEGTLQFKEFLPEQNTVSQSGTSLRLGFQTNLLDAPFVKSSGKTLDPYLRAAIERRTLHKDEIGYQLELGLKKVSMSYQHFPDSNEKRLNINFNVNF